MVCCNPSLRSGENAREGYWRNPWCGYLKWSIEIVTLVGFNQKPISTMDRFEGSTIYIPSIRVLWVSEILLSGLNFFPPFREGLPFAFRMDL